MILVEQKTRACKVFCSPESPLTIRDCAALRVMVKPSKRKYFAPKTKEQFRNPNAIVVTSSGVKINSSNDETSTAATSKLKSSEPLSFDKVDEKLNDTHGSDQTVYDRERVIGEVNPYNVSPANATSSNSSNKTPSDSSIKFGRRIVRFDSLYLTSCSGVLSEVAIGISIIICVLTAIPNLCGKNDRAHVSTKDNNDFEWLFTHRQSNTCYYADIYFIFNITSIGIQSLLLSFYTFHFIEYTSWFPWLCTEVVFYSLLVMGHFIIGSICIATSSGTVFAAGVLGVFLAFVCVTQFISKFHKCRKGQHAQPGEGDPDNEDARLSEGRKRFKISRQETNQNRSPGRFWKL